MNIKPISSTPVGEVAVTPTKNSSQTASVQNNAGQDAASVQLSTKATDPEKLEKLKQQVKSGTYAPDLGEVAKAIARDLL